jgi:ATP-dependent DNA helicase RecQ
VTKEEGKRLLRVLTGRSEAEFRPGQWEAVERLVVQRGRALVVQRTGWGKSAVYFLATRLLRQQGAGPTLLISPLLALMRDQIKMAERAGIRAATSNSTNSEEEWEDVEKRVAADEVDLLLVSPEWLQNKRFRANVLPQLLRRVGLLVVDEAHCISEWGHDFRPEYRRIGRILDRLPSTVPVLCTTATAPNRVVEDVVQQLGAALVVQRGPLDRESLALSVVHVPAQAQRLAWLAQVVPRLPGSGIVYCLTVADADRVAGWLRSQGIDAAPYSGPMDNAVRVELEDRLLRNDLKVLVATSALGMGFEQAGPAVRHPLPGPAVGRRLLPAGRPGGTSPGAGARHPAGRGRGRRDPGLLHLHRLSRRG